MRLPAPNLRRLGGNGNGPFAAANRKHHHHLTREPSIAEDAPSVCESDVSSVTDFLWGDDDYSIAAPAEPRKPLQWEFKGLTLWIEFEEHDQDLSRALEFASQFYGTERIPIPHATAIYGMEHLSEEEAMAKLEGLVDLFPNGWPSKMDKPISVKQDLSVEGRPGQVCSIAWAELTLKTNKEHEAAIQKLYDHFEVSQHDEKKSRNEWTPHISLAYDNPDDSVLNLMDTIAYVSQNPTLMKERRVKAISLWSTKGKMAQWKCLDRISFF